MSHRRAFTLIELIIVIVVLVIIAAIALPSFALLVDTSREAVADRGADAVARNARALAGIDDNRVATDAEYDTSATEAGTWWDAGSNTLTVPVRTVICTVKFTNLATGTHDPAICPGSVPGGPLSIAVWGFPAAGPQGVPFDETATVVVAGSSHWCALTDAQAVYCWGDNTYGQLGDGTNTSSTTPVPVDTSVALAGKTVTQLAAGDLHTCVVADGAAYCWGQNNYGQLGVGTTTNSNVPVAVDTSGVLAGKTVTSVHPGAHTCAVADGAAYCWGQNTYGQLGDGNGGSYFDMETWQFVSLGDSTVPVAVDASGVLSGKTVTSISATGWYTCAVASGAAYCWGENFSGQLGNGTNTHSPVPVAVSASGVLSGKTVTAISAGPFSYACAIADGDPYCWGSLSYTAPGIPTVVVYNSNVPVAVDTSGALAGKTSTAITAGIGHACVIADGAAYCWGINDGSQLGNGPTPTVSTSPVAVDTSGVLAGRTVTSITIGFVQTAVTFS